MDQSTVFIMTFFALVAAFAIGFFVGSESQFRKVMRSLDELAEELTPMGGDGDRGFIKVGGDIILTDLDKVDIRDLMDAVGIPKEVIASEKAQQILSLTGDDKAEFLQILRNSSSVKDAVDGYAKLLARIDLEKKGSSLAKDGSDSHTG